MPRPDDGQHDARRDEQQSTTNETHSDAAEHRAGHPAVDAPAGDGPVDLAAADVGHHPCHRSGDHRRMGAAPRPRPATPSRPRTGVTKLDPPTPKMPNSTPITRPAAVTSGQAGIRSPHLLHHPGTTYRGIAWSGQLAVARGIHLHDDCFPRVGVARRRPGAGPADRAVIDALHQRPSFDRVVEADGIGPTDATGLTRPRHPPPIDVDGRSRSCVLVSGSAVRVRRAS